MSDDAMRLVRAICRRVQPLIRAETAACLRCAVYTVTTPPAAGAVGVTAPGGTKELTLPYAAAVSDAEEGDRVLVVWHGTLSNARVWFFADGPE